MANYHCFLGPSAHSRCYIESIQFYRQCSAAPAELMGSSIRVKPPSQGPGCRNYNNVISAERVLIQTWMKDWDTEGLSDGTNRRRKGLRKGWMSSIWYGENRLSPALCFISSLHIRALICIHLSSRGPNLPGQNTKVPVGSLPAWNSEEHFHQITKPSALPLLARGSVPPAQTTQPLCWGRNLDSSKASDSDLSYYSGLWELCLSARWCQSAWEVWRK